MKKVFAISLHRSGTQSLNELLKAQGYNSLHWPAIWQGIDYQELTRGKETDYDAIVSILKPVLLAHDSISDVPICAIYEQLAAAFPDAAFLSLKRPPEDWLRSIRRHTEGRILDPYEKAQYWRYLPSRPECLDMVEDVELIAIYQQHYSDISKFFANDNRYFEGDLLDKYVGEKISFFLNMPALPLQNIDFVKVLMPEKFI